MRPADIHSTFSLMQDQKRTERFCVDPAAAGISLALCMSALVIVSGAGDEAKSEDDLLAAAEQGQALLNAGIVEMDRLSEAMDEIFAALKAQRFKGKPAAGVPC